MYDPRQFKSKSFFEKTKAVVVGVFFGKPTTKEEITATLARAEEGLRRSQMLQDEVQMLQDEVQKNIAKHQQMNFQP